jgi:ATP-binding cassette subfamily C exporter for protease/lipase
VFAGMAWLSHRLTRQPVETALEAGSQLGAYVHGKLRNADVIEAMGMLGNLRRRWQARHRHHLNLNGRAADVAARVQALTKFVRYTQQSLTLAAGALLVIEGELSAGAMIAANVLMGRATQPLDQIVASWKPFLGARKAFRDLDALLAEHPPRDSGRVHDAPRGHMRIDALVATAPGRPRPILNGLSADFDAAQVIVIIGPSGSGKSTLARALVGIWPEREGSVLIDGEPIESWDREELGPFLGYLPQDIELFEGSIAENIARFGALDPEKVIRACERAGVHDMILRFAQGYDTQVGEAGGLLSGGQRQRIGLARAMYGDPRVIVLDEPNSNLDDVGEAALLRAVQDLKRQGSTVFLITHRRGIVGIADRLLVLDDGVIAHDGPRQEVLAALAGLPRRGARRRNPPDLRPIHFVLSNIVSGSPSWPYATSPRAAPPAARGKPPPHRCWTPSWRCPPIPPARRAWACGCSASGSAAFCCGRRWRRLTRGCRPPAWWPSIPSARRCSICRAASSAKCS